MERKRQPLALLVKIVLTTHGKWKMRLNSQYSISGRPQSYILFGLCGMYTVWEVLVCIQNLSACFRFSISQSASIPDTLHCFCDRDGPITHGLEHADQAWNLLSDISPAWQSDHEWSRASQSGWRTRPSGIIRMQKKSGVRWSGNVEVDWSSDRLHGSLCLWAMLHLVLIPDTRLSKTHHILEGDVHLIRDITLWMLGPWIHRRDPGKYLYTGYESMRIERSNFQGSTADQLCLYQKQNSLIVRTSKCFVQEPAYKSSRDKRSLVSMRGSLEACKANSKKREFLILLSV